MSATAVKPSSQAFMSTGLPLFAELPFKVKDPSEATVRFGRKEIELAEKVGFEAAAATRYHGEATRIFKR